jgi:replication factor C subunit 1
MKTQDKSGTSKPSGAAAAADKKKPVLSIPEKKPPAPSLVGR